MAIKIRVKVVLRNGRGYVLRWRCPETGAWKEKATKTESKKEADKFGAQLEADLQQGRYVAPSKVTWEDFRFTFELEKLPSLAPRSRNSYRSSLNHVEKSLHPEKLSELDSASMSRLQTRLRDQGLRESSIATHLRHIKSALKWAHDLGMLVNLPKVQMPKRARNQRHMRGRPITREEVERMLKACELVRPRDASDWMNFLEGLWCSGLRLGEALALSWDVDAAISLDLSGKYPCLLISAESEKGFRDRRLPITPEFSSFINVATADDRHDKVFSIARRGFGIDRASRVIVAIGKKAMVVVNKEQGKYASAHDFRRAFATRWASRVQPVVLKELMRHASIETTLKYYVGCNSDEIGCALWNAPKDSAALSQGHLEV